MIDTIGKGRFHAAGWAVWGGREGFKTSNGRGAFADGGYWNPLQFGPKDRRAITDFSRFVTARRETGIPVR
ncbi:MAG TPA: hypothetical protein VGG20_19630 [Thermoanaerobaculia bacterium]|jgi:hypothetical protein